MTLRTTEIAAASLESLRKALLFNYANSGKNLVIIVLISSLPILSISSRNLIKRLTVHWMVNGAVLRPPTNFSNMREDGHVESPVYNNLNHTMDRYLDRFIRFKEKERL